MNFPLKSFLLFCLPATVFLATCGRTSTCRKELKCSTLTSSDSHNSVIEERRTYCSVTDASNDQVYQDSLSAFYKRHSADTSNLVKVDSTFYFDSQKVKMKETSSWTKKGYSCIGAK